LNIVIKNRKVKRANYLRRHSRKLLERRSRYKAKKKKRNQYYNISGDRRKNIHDLTIVRREGYKIIKAPQNFSMTKNTEETLKFIGKLERCYEKKQKTFIDLFEVNNIASGAIVVLLSILIKFKTSKIGFNGNFPKNPKAKSNLTASGFLDHLFLKNIPQSDTYAFEKDICTHADREVDSSLSAKLIGKASKFIWGEERACRGVQRIFVELMQNTYNHASRKEGEQYWWASVKNSIDDNKVRFSFIDYGVGIFDSLAHKKPGGKFSKIANILIGLVASNKNDELLKKLVEGEIHKIAQISYYRGKGLPGIWNACNNNAVSNLMIISNDALADFSRKNFVKLDNKLSGTFVYWELNKGNINKELRN
jgi:hypothetical protein